MKSIADYYTEALEACRIPNPQHRYIDIQKMENILEARLLNKQVVSVKGTYGKITKFYKESERTSRFSAVDIEWNNGNKTFGQFCQILDTVMVIE